jgi:predicted Zn-dependent peptidase
MSYQITTLDSGLRIATETMASVETVSVAVSVDVGARYESEPENGLAHFLEHMAFKGTARRDARTIAEAFDDIGGHGNAYTSSEQTVYYAKVLKEELPVAVDILGDILLHSTFEPEEVERERGVILQEIAMHHDSPDDLIYDVFQDAAFPDQPIGRSILGIPENIARFQRADFVGWMERFYHPKNIVVTAAGNLTHDALVDLAQEHLAFTPRAVQPKPQAGVYRGTDKRMVRDLEQLHLMMGWECGSVHHPDYYALQMLSIILGGGMSSRLFQEVREKRGLAYHVQSMVSVSDDCGVFSLYAATSEEHAAELVPVLCAEVLRLADSVTEEELVRAKKQHRASMLMAKENTSSLAEWIGRHLLVYGEYKTAETLTNIIQSVTLDDIRRLARQFAKDNHLVVAALGPQQGLEPYEAMTKRFG